MKEVNWNSLVELSHVSRARPPERAGNAGCSGNKHHTYAEEADKPDESGPSKIAL